MLELIIIALTCPTALGFIFLCIHSTIPKEPKESYFENKKRCYIFTYSYLMAKRHHQGQIAICTARRDVNTFEFIEYIQERLLKQFNREKAWVYDIQVTNKIPKEEVMKTLYIV